MILFFEFVTFVPNFRDFTISERPNPLLALEPGNLVSGCLYVFVTTQYTCHVSCLYSNIKAKALLVYTVSQGFCPDRAGSGHQMQGWEMLTAK